LPVAGDDASAKAVVIG